MKCTRQQTIETTVEHSLELSRTDIIKCCNAAGFDVPQGAEIFFSVPTAGDCFGDDIEIDPKHPVRVRWMEIKKEVSCE